MSGRGNAMTRSEGECDTVPMGIVEIKEEPQSGLKGLQEPIKEEILEDVVLDDLAVVKEEPVFISEGDVNCVINDEPTDDFKEEPDEAELDDISRQHVHSVDEDSMQVMAVPDTHDDASRFAPAMMGRTRPRSTSKAGWDEAALQKAKQLVCSGLSIRRASSVCNIPFTSLRKRIRDPTMAKNPRLGRRPVFTPEQEKTFADRVLLLSNLYCGVTPQQLRQAAYNFAEEFKIPHNFKNGTAGKDWLMGFTRRHPIIKIRKPEATLTEFFLSTERR